MKVFVIGSVPFEKGISSYVDGHNQLSAAATILGRTLAKRGHQLVVCSPFEDSADFYVVKGVSEIASTDRRHKIEFYYPAADRVIQSLACLKSQFANLEILQIAQPRPVDEGSREAWKHAWLLAQLGAVEASSVVVAIAGKSDGLMSFLLPFADMRKKPILPYTFLGGAAAQWFDKQLPILVDWMGNQLPRLSDPGATAEVADLLDVLTSGGNISQKRLVPLKFFISYAKARPSEADFIEMVLRRRQFTVFRDDRDFGAGSWVESEINRYIDRCSVFIAVWCQEYACSPWCFDELNYALDRHDQGQLNVWIVPVDETRIVPPRARKLLGFDLTTSREQLEGRLIKEIERASSFGGSAYS